MKDIFKMATGSKADLYWNAQSVSYLQQTLKYVVNRVFSIYQFKLDSDVSEYDLPSLALLLCITPCVKTCVHSRMSKSEKNC